MLQHATNGYKGHNGYNTPQRQQCHKDYYATNATTPQRQQEVILNTKVYKSSRVPRTQEVMLTNSQETKSPYITQIDAHNAMAKTTLRCPSPSLPNSLKKLLGK
jgi:hypothetical protein